MIRPPLDGNARDEILNGLRELHRRAATGEAIPLDYILIGEILMWWRMRR